MPSCLRCAGDRTPFACETGQDREPGERRCELWLRCVLSRTLGCTDSYTVPDVLDALVRTILSQNTTSKNSTNARQSIEEHYGKGPNYEAVRQGTQEELKEVIQSGGLANVKARVIKKILDQVHEKEGKLSLDRLHTVGDEDALRELVSFDGVGPKTVSLVARRSICAEMRPGVLCPAILHGQRILRSR